MSPPLFAFGWISLPMLGWLAVAAAPLLIHLWMRRRYRETTWAAMEYLLAAMRQQTRRIRFEQWLLLLIRTLLIVLVVLAVAEPYLESKGLAFAPGGRVHRMLVFDGSYSMAYKPGDKSRFDRAKELARRIVEESAEGDAFTLILMSSTPRVVVGTAALSPASILHEIDELQLPHAGADLPAAVATVRRLVENVGRENPRLVRHEVYFLTDLQRVTWAPKMSEATRAELRRQVGDLGRAASLVLVDVGQPAAENLAVTGLDAPEPPVTVGRDVPLAVRLAIKPRPLSAPDDATNGRSMANRQPVELFVDGRRIERKEVAMPADGTASVTFTHRFDAPGEHAVEVRAPGDALEIDNRRFLAVPVREAVRALCIDGRPAGGSFRGAADYLAVALSPHAGQGGVSGPPPVQVEVAPEGALMDHNLANYDCVFLCNVAQLTASEAQTLDAYLRGGGNVIFFLGDQVLAERYNQVLGVVGQVDNLPHQQRQVNNLPNSADKRPAREGRAGGLGLLPARIGPLVDRPQFRLDPLGYRHPIVQTFRGRGETSLLTTPVFKHYKLMLPAGSEAATVLSLADGDPLIVEQRVHRGRVVVVATSAEPSWTALPLWPSFVPLVQEMIAYGAVGQLRQRNLAVGDPIETVLKLSSAGGPVAVQSPDGRRHPVEPRPMGDSSVVDYPDTTQSGVYVVHAGPSADRNPTFAVNVDTVESDLTRAEADEVKQAFGGAAFTYRTSLQASGFGTVVGAAGGGARLHVGLLYAALALLLFETWLAWRMGGGRTKDPGEGRRTQGKDE